MTHAVNVSGLSKRYTLRHETRPRYGSLRESLTNGVTSLAKRVVSGRWHPATTVAEEFWALRDVNFSVEPGERLGIIGRNGAGKSTLLKTLSRITEPTEGRVEIRGRVSSLLEVGTGFHPELTGRENIFLNGAILGMTSNDIRRKFDEIVAFADVERFLDTPVKRYSSGMYVRLAFSVAAHLEPDILVIDEVLSVGDAEFQRKCLGKMKDATGDGRTVIFVSHNMTTVNSLCNRCVLLDGGRVKMIGDAGGVTEAYFSADERGGGGSLSYSSPALRPGDAIARLCSARLIDESKQKIVSMRLDRAIGVEITFSVETPGYRLVPNFHIFTQGQCVFVSSPIQRGELACGIYRSTMWVPPRLLNDGLYSVGLALTSLNPVLVHFFVQDALSFQVLDDLGDARRNDYTLAVPGVIRPALDWNFEAIGDER